MKNVLNKLRTDKIIWNGNCISLCLMVITVLTIAFFYRNLPPFMPVFNQMPWGEQRLGTTITFFYPITLTFIFFLSNIFFSFLLYDKMPLISRILTITTILVTCILGIFTIRTLQLIL